MQTVVSASVKCRSHFEMFAGSLVLGLSQYLDVLTMLLYGLMPLNIPSLIDGSFFRRQQPKCIVSSNMESGTSCCPCSHIVDTKAAPRIITDTGVKNKI